MQMEQIGAGISKRRKQLGLSQEDLAKQIADNWLETPFSEDERHVRRIAKLMALEG